MAKDNFNNFIRHLEKQGPSVNLAMKALDPKDVVLQADGFGFSM